MEKERKSSGERDRGRAMEIESERKSDGEELNEVHHIVYLYTKSMLYHYQHHLQSIHSSIWNRGVYGNKNTQNPTFE